MSTPPYNQGAEEADKVQKRQKTSEGKVAACIDQLIQQVTSARDELQRISQCNGANATNKAQESIGKLRSTVDTVVKEANTATKELHSAISKLSKVVDACVDEVVDLGKVMRVVAWNPTTLHMIIAEHFYRQGLFQVGSMLAFEAGLRDAQALAEPFTAMHTVLEQVRARNLQPALQWSATQLALLQAGSLPSSHPSSQVPGQADASAGGAERADAGAGAMASAAGGVGAGTGRRDSGASQRGAAAAATAVRSFQFRLHSLNFLDALLNHGQAAALTYAREHFSPFATSHMKEIQKLMGCMVYCTRTRAAAKADSNGTGSQPMATSSVAGDTGQDVVMSDATPSGGSPAPPPASGGSVQGGAAGTTEAAGTRGPLAGTPYAHLAGPGAWQEAAAEFSRLACSLMGMAAESPLATVVAAGAAALPGLHKLMSVLTAGVAAELSVTDQLPVELELGAEFVFHPIFACPVSRDQSTPDNPPLLLPCNHVLCEQSVFKIAKNRTRIFKCPYCPVEARVDNLRPLVFPALE